MPPSIKDVFKEIMHVYTMMDMAISYHKTSGIMKLTIFGRHFLSGYSIPLAIHIDIIISNRAISVLTRGFGFCSLIQKSAPNYLIDIHCDQLVFLLSIYMYHWILNNSINIQVTYIWQV